VGLAVDEKDGSLLVADDVGIDGLDKSAIREEIVMEDLNRRTMVGAALALAGLNGVSRGPLSPRTPK